MSDEQTKEVGKRLRERKIKQMVDSEILKEINNIAIKYNITKKDLMDLGAYFVLSFQRKGRGE